MKEYDVKRVSTPPHVHDATQPAPEPATDTMPRPGVLVAVFGTPVDGGVPMYVASLGYCVWRAGEATDEFLTEDDEIVTEDGIPLTE